ncbi:MAG: hypothetical protein ACRYGP_22365 [Janthinobacterium lividum]
MVSSRGVSALVCAVVGLSCIVDVLRSHGGSDAAAVVMAIPPAPQAPSPAEVAVVAAPARTIAAPAQDTIDTSLATGSIPPGPALHVPNPAAYAEAAKAGTSPTVTEFEAINYLTGNTLRRDTPGQPLHLTYFSTRGVLGEGDERGFTARHWQRETPKLCETDSGGETLCRTVTIVLDGKYEFPGARLGTVTLGAVGASGPQTAELVKGDVLHFPDHIPLLDSSLDVAADASAGSTSRPVSSSKGGDAFDAMVGEAAALVPDGDGKDRQIVYYARDNRRLELQPVQTDDGRAVQVTVGHWRSTKGTLCQSRVIGEAAQTCFKIEPLAGHALRLMPAGKMGEPQTLTALPETDLHAIAQD